MKTKVIKLLFGSLACVLLASCAPKMYLDTEGDFSAPVDKSQPHFIAPPLKSWPIEERNLYPVIVKAFLDNGVNVTNNLRSAVYAVDWGSEDKSTQLNGDNYLPDISYTSGTVSNENGTADYSGTTIGGSYVPYSYTYFVKSFGINVFKVNLHAPLSEWTKVWTGSASAQASDVNDPALVIRSMVAHYGSSSKGFQNIGSVPSQ